MAKLRGGRIQNQAADGRFVRNTTENTFGLRTKPCKECAALNPYGRKEVKKSAFIDPSEFNQWDEPTTCSQCGKPL